MFVSVLQAQMSCRLEVFLSGGLWTVLGGQSIQMRSADTGGVEGGSVWGSVG